MLTNGIPPEFRGGVHLFIFNRLTPSGQSRVYRVTQLRTDGVHCRESAGTGPINLKIDPNECCLTMDQLMCASLSHTHYWYEVSMLKVYRGSIAAAAACAELVGNKVGNHVACTLYLVAVSVGAGQNWSDVLQKQKIVAHTRSKYHTPPAWVVWQKYNFSQTLGEFLRSLKFQILKLSVG